MKVKFEDMGEAFKPPFRFLPFCPKCNAELQNGESPCEKCKEPLEWFDPYEEK